MRINEWFFVRLQWLTSAYEVIAKSNVATIKHVKNPKSLSVIMAMCDKALTL